jgi:hypothetical protein
MTAMMPPHLSGAPRRAGGGNKTYWGSLEKVRKAVHRVSKRSMHDYFAAQAARPLHGVRD